MSSLLIDRKNLKRYNIYNLLEMVGDHPETKDEIGYVFLSKSDQVNILNKLPKGKERVDYINTLKFISSISSFYTIIYNINKKICEIRTPMSKKHIKRVSHALITYLPTNVTIWTGLIPVSSAKNYIQAGFIDPYKTKISPLGYKFNHYGIAFIKINIPVSNLEIKSEENKLRYVLKQTHESKCTIYARLTPRAVKFLRQLNKPSASLKNKELAGKELAGSLYVSNVKNSNGKIVFELTEDLKSIKAGLAEEVDAVWSRYNFHTHPKIAYINHGVTNGWPSSQDYVGMIMLDNHTICHTVVTLEGVYIISFSPEYNGDVRKIDKNKILDDFDIDHKDDITCYQYTKIINNKKYNGKRLFIVKYMKWNNASQIFPVMYKKTEGMCLSTDKIFNLVSKN